MATRTATYGGATQGAISGAKLGNMLLPGGVGAVAGGIFGGGLGAIFGKKTDEAYDKRQERLKGQLTDMQGTLTDKVPGILEYYKNLEEQSLKEDDLSNRSIIDSFLTQNNQLFTSGQEAMARSNLAYGGPLAKDIENQWEDMFKKYKASTETQDLASERDMATIDMSRTEAIEKVDNLVEQLEIDKMKLG